MTTVFEQAWSTMQSFAWYEWVALLTGIVYVWLAALQKRSCWYWGILSCALWAYADINYYLLYLDALLQFFYIGMGIWGLKQWSAASTGVDLQIERMSWRDHLRFLWWVIPGSFLFGYLFDNYTPAAATYADAFTTIAAIAATWLTVRRYLENWIYWIVIDLIYIGITGSRTAYLYALLYLIYTLVAIWGLISWYRVWRRQ
ncbi:MAG: nicotinamide riboside transporter PnuC [Saprospiraceae bacterium]